MMKKALLIVSTAGLTVVALFIVYVVLFTGPPSTTEMNKLIAEGDEIVEKLKQYHASHDRYPSSLAEAGIQSPKSAYGSWEYIVESDGTRFFLAIGDYEKHLFRIWWEFEANDWYIDR